MFDIQLEMERRLCPWFDVITLRICTGPCSTSSWKWREGSVHGLMSLLYVYVPDGELTVKEVRLTRHDKWWSHT